MPGIGEAAKAIGKRATITTREELAFQVRIVDARSVFKRVEFLVRPMSGEGEA